MTISPIGKKVSFKPTYADEGLLVKARLANIINQAQKRGTTHQLLGIEKHKDISKKLPLEIVPEQISYSSVSGKISIAGLLVDFSIIEGLIGGAAFYALLKDLAKSLGFPEVEDVDPYEVDQNQISFHV